MSKFRLLAAVALVAGFFAVQSASSATMKDTFTVTIGADSGPWSGNTYTGSFTWDSNKPGSLLTFESDLPIWSPGEKLGMIFLPNPPVDPIAGFSPWSIYLDPLPTSSPSSFILAGIGSENATFSYGNPGGVSWIADSVQITDPPVNSPTPEPGTVWLVVLGLGGVLALIRSKRTA